VNNLSVVLEGQVLRRQEQEQATTGDRRLTSALDGRLASIEEAAGVGRRRRRRRSKWQHSGFQASGRLRHSQEMPKTSKGKASFLILASAVRPKPTEVVNAKM